MQPLQIPEAYVKKVAESRYGSLKDEIMDQEQRKRERIRRFKMQQLKNTLKEEEEEEEAQLMQEVAYKQKDLSEFERKKEAKLRLVQEVNRYKQEYTRRGERGGDTGERGMGNRGYYVG